MTTPSPASIALMSLMVGSLALPFTVIIIVQISKLLRKKK